MNEQEQYQKAKKRVEAKLGFYIHLAIYVAVSLLLIVINMTASAQTLWSPWPILGWGIGVFFHGASVFFMKDDSAWKKQMIEKELHKQN